MFFKCIYLGTIFDLCSWQGTLGGTPVLLMVSWSYRRDKTGTSQAMRFFSFAFMFDRFVVPLFGNGEESLAQK